MSALIASVHRATVRVVWLQAAASARAAAEHREIVAAARAAAVRRAIVAAAQAAAEHREIAAAGQVEPVGWAEQVAVLSAVAGPACSLVQALRWHGSIPTSSRSTLASWDSGHVPSSLSSQMGRLAGHFRRYNTS